MPEDKGLEDMGSFALCLHRYGFYNVKPSCENDKTFGDMCSPLLIDRENRISIREYSNQ